MDTWNRNFSTSLATRALWNEDCTCEWMNNSSSLSSLVLSETSLASIVTHWWMWTSQEDLRFIFWELIWMSGVAVTTAFTRKKVSMSIINNRDIFHLIFPFLRVQLLVVALSSLKMWKYLSFYFPFLHRWYNLSEFQKLNLRKNSSSLSPL